ncbi:MFS general substrate transporter [Mycena sp. CBHHK59/15]|nr:MFS general substrate transporter [Mycena sp. CBHHK59/15]
MASSAESTPTAQNEHGALQLPAAERMDTETLSPPVDGHGPAPGSAKGKRFWLSFAAIMVAIFLSALDLTAIGTALPTISASLHDVKGEFEWVGSAYALASTAFMPLSGSLADIFGRKPTMLLAISFFAVGSALAGAAQNMDMMIAARTIQGIGGGGIINLAEIITSDLVPLAERGLYQGLLGLMWSFASAVGPPIGGALTQNGTKAWRWLFFLNLPLTGIAAGLVLVFLTVRTPEGSIKSKLARVDWGGNFLVVVGTTLAIIGLTWGGIQYPWGSAHVLAPLIIGIFLLAVFVVYEAKVPSEPTIPYDVLSNRTTLSGILATAAHGISSIAVMYYLPVYFQASFEASPLQSVKDFLPSTFVIAPCTLLCGATVNIVKKYRPINWIGWCFMVVGFGLLSTLAADSPTAKWAGYQAIVGAGIGIIFVGPIFVVLAPLPVNRAASALALFAFTRAFTQTWGIAIAGTILQNQLKRNLPPAFVAQFPAGAQFAYAAIPAIKTLEEPLRTEVRTAFATSMAVIWKVMIGVAGLGMVFSAFMSEITLSTAMDENYALEHKKAERADEEKVVDSK